MYPYTYSSWPMHTDFSTNAAPPEQDPPNREIHVDHGETAHSQYLPRTQAQLGLGPLPTSLCAKQVLLGVVNPPRAPTHRSASLLSPYPDQAFLTHTPIPDIGAMVAAMSLKQTRHAEQNQVLAEQNQILATQNTTLQGRVDALERATLRVPESDAPQIDSRLLAASRKKKAKVAQRRERGPIAGTEPSEPNPAAALSRASDLTVTLSTQTFREVCNVSSKEAWPDPHLIRLNEITGERYPTPNFDVPVTESGNARLIGLIAQRMDQSLQEQSSRPTALVDSGATWDLTFLRETAKKSFGNLKPKWRGQTNPQVAAHAQLEERSNRRRQRQVLKVQQKTSVLHAFAAQHAVDPKDLAPLLHEQYESDEESGPEDNSEESKDAWKMRMAASCGITVTSRAVLAELDFVEVLVPEWQSDIVS
ncbi:hypothetical protein K438DRAFT_1982638 [Mycena galopus ATCC 62051]|nr:hypothetical protein K438DRAFT_1982638 [Mycena galopus ATCC 62051]